MAIVVSGLAVVIYMIASSYQRSIMAATTITNNPVTDLGFATVTICPLPKGGQHNA